MNDPVVNEIRIFRDKHSRLFNYDLDAICNDYKSKHQFYIKKLKTLKNKKNPDKTLPQMQIRH
jgi:hypothetical protein